MCVRFTILKSKEKNRRILASVEIDDEDTSTAEMVGNLFHFIFWCNGRPSKDFFSLYTHIYYSIGNLSRAQIVFTFVCFYSLVVVGPKLSQLVFAE